MACCLLDDIFLRMHSLLQYGQLANFQNERNKLVPYLQTTVFEDLNVIHLDYGKLYKYGLKMSTAGEQGVIVHHNDVAQSQNRVNHS